MKIYTLVFGALVACPMQAQTMHDWENHHVLQINREPARAAFTPFSVQKGDCSISLDGTWKFRWTPVPGERIIDFYQTDFNDKDWKDFPVPANWEIRSDSIGAHSSGLWNGKRTDRLFCALKE